MHARNPFKTWLLYFLLFLAMQITTQAFAENIVDVDDNMITTNIKSKIMSDQSLSAFDIGVSTKDGIVSLSGHVDSDNQASTLLELIQSVDGVRDINAEKLSLKESDSSFSDLLITSKIKGMFIQEKLFGDGHENEDNPTNIEVRTHDGVVHLSGTAENQEQAEDAVAITKSISGVKKVKSTIRVERDISED